MRRISVAATTAFIIASIQGSFSFITSRRRILHTHVIPSSRIFRGQLDAINEPNGSNNNDNFKTANGNDIDEFNQLKITFVTGNAMKARELNLILAEEQATKGPSPETSLVDLKIVNVDLPEIQEVNTEAIAKNKAILGAQLAGGPCVVEDTSLQFNALGGMVSVHGNRYDFNFA